MERESKETWSKRVERWKESDLRAAEFASEIGVKAHSLKWWKWRLGYEARMASSPTPRKKRKRGATQKASVGSPMTFVEVTGSIRRAPLEVVLVSGRTIRVPDDFDASTLARLLIVLEQRV